MFAFDLPVTDIVARDGDTITLGDTTIALYNTPGHTPGVLTMRYAVQDGRDFYDAITLGGVGLNFSGVEQTEAYIDSYERLISLQNGVSVSLPNHAAMAGIFERRDRLQSRAPGDPHPFVDPHAYQASLEEFLTAARDKLEAERAGTARDPFEVLRDTLDD